MRVNFWSIFLSSYGSLLIYGDSLIMMTIQPFSTIFSPWLFGLPSPQPLTSTQWSQHHLTPPVSYKTFPTSCPRVLRDVAYQNLCLLALPGLCLVSHHLGQLPPWLPHLSTKTGLTEAVTPGVIRVGLLRINCPSFSAFPRDSSVHLSFPCL